MRNMSAAETPGDPSSKLSFRNGSRDLEFAVEQPVENGANECGAVHRRAGPVSHVLGKAIELHDLSIEQHDRHLRPRFGVDTRAPAARFTSVPEPLWCDALRGH